jgi:hypothetical protein
MKKEDRMALINKKHVTERETASYKLDRATVELVRLYAEFIGSPQEHVVNESLLYLFRKDKEFADWLKANGKEIPAPPRDSENKASSQQTVPIRYKA